ncbi:fasciclin domain-containing protein [Plectonema cf. radiosum LEGE 06105]|uniref:Fasciclin domain-containing protein n=1 Tax=Plectonema cf. radiosum LEGE 06105 TaxID=945769 RepID=A0A8J7F9V6_9CYAN|nr:fasciclin domain-containing protein [Plectonema radiosum]MBE9212273.1 fasciclin domain-containing protein [Plectonema cf. radiosum LEGE 06105]
MKLSLKLFAGLASAVGFTFGSQIPTLAQVIPSPNQVTPNPTQVNPSLNQVTPTPGAVPTPNINNAPASTLPFFTSANTIVIPRDSQSMTAAEVVSLSPSFEMLNSLLRVAGQNSDLIYEFNNDDDFYRVYAPTDEAFAALPIGTIKLLVQPENRDLLKQILSYHIRQSEGEAEFEQVGIGDTSTALSQEPGLTGEVNEGLDAQTSEELVRYQARVIGAPVGVDNGVIYPINRLLIPPELQTQLNLNTVNTQPTMSN